MLEKYSFLNCRISIYIPSTMNVNEKTDNKKYVVLISKWMSKIFGGCTAYKATGTWLSDASGLVNEDVTIVYSFTDEKTLKNNESFLINICEWLKKEMRQEAISLEINNKLYFI